MKAAKSSFPIWNFSFFIKYFHSNSLNIRDINSWSLARAPEREEVHEISFSASFVKEITPARVFYQRATGQKEKNEQKSHFRMTAKKKRQNRNLHKLITFTVVTCEAQWRKVIFTTINLTTFTDDHGWGERCYGNFGARDKNPKRGRHKKSFALKNIAFLLIPTRKKLT